MYQISLLPVIAILLVAASHVVRAQPSSPSSQAMQMRLNITAPSGAEICLPFGGSVNVSVRIYWGDGIQQDVVSAAAVGNVSHQYNLRGVYDIHIDRLGPGPKWLDKFSDGYDCWYNRLYAANAGYLVSVTSFGDLGITSLNGGFTSSNQLTSIPSVLPATVTDLGFAFAGSAFNHSLPWDVSRVTNMAGLFSDNTVFNQPLDAWDVSRVTSMAEMFYFARAFNQPFLSWDVSKVTSFQSMFFHADAFNGAIGSWNTSSATDMAQMFWSSSFNQNINNWDVSNVRDMTRMFQSSQFNQPLDRWNVSRVTDFFQTFARSPFNQPINTWIMSSARRIAGMFEGANSFNQPLNLWNISSVTAIHGLFNGASAFNQPINAWNVSNVRDSSYMFQGANAFNQPLDTWDVRKATNMIFMFNNAPSFQQDISYWCAPLISAAPSAFAPALPSSFQPRWGDCLSPRAARVPSVAPVPPSRPCATTTCIPQSVEVGSNSSSNIVVFQNTTTIVGDLRITTPNATIVLTVQPSTTANPINPAAIQVSGCVTFGGRLNVTIAESVSLSSSQELTIATYDAGYCDGNSETSTKFESVDVDLGCRTTTGTTIQYNAKSLSLVFGEIKSDNCPSSVAGSPAPRAPFPLTELVVGCVAGVVLISIIVGTVLYWRRKNRLEEERKEMQSRLAAQK